jgi:hypothetical protein
LGGMVFPLESTTIYVYQKKKKVFVPRKCPKLDENVLCIFLEKDPNFCSTSVFSSKMLIFFFVSCSQTVTNTNKYKKSTKKRKTCIIKLKAEQQTQASFTVNLRTQKTKKFKFRKNDSRKCHQPLSCFAHNSDN